MLPPEPTRDSEHKYHFRGVEYPSVTQILKAVGMVNYSSIPAAIMEAAMMRGSYAHEACELDDQGRLDETQLDPRLLPYLQAWRAFKKEAGVEVIPEWTERKMVSEALGYAGTMDRLVRWKGGEVCLDIKTGKCMRWTGVQLAGYDILRGSFGVSNSLRLGLELRKDGTYKIVEFQFRNDYDVWMAALKVFNFGKGGA